MDRRDFLKKGTAAAGITMAREVILSGTQPLRAASLDVPATGDSSVLGHDYDPISDRVAWRTIDRHHAALGQSFTVPSTADQISGFRMKIRRLGDTADLSYKIGSFFGADDIAAGMITASKVNPFFEFFYGDDFAPKPCRSGQKLYIQLALETAPASGGYEVYGTQSEYEVYGVAAEDESPVNIDYGTRTPTYHGGSGIDSSGQPLAGVDFAFEVYFGPAGSRKPNTEEEPRFEFVKEFMRGPHTRSSRDHSVTPKKGDVSIDDAWKIIWAGGGSDISQVALNDFRQFLKVGMGVSPSVQIHERLGTTATTRVITLCTRNQLPSFAADLKSSESYRVQADESHVLVCGYDERGLMRGLHYLEDLMNFRKAPFLAKTDVVRSPRYTPRITCLPFYAGMELDAPVSPYTNEALSLISHYGFNAIWIWAKLHDLGKSSIFPELGSQAEKQIASLNDVIRRASHYGLDVYLYVSKDGLPPDFFEAHPEVRGSRSYFKTGYAMCTSVLETQEYIRGALKSIFKSAPGLKGMVFIIGGEGFVHCWTRRNAEDCPRCRNRGPVDVVAEVVEAVNQGAKSGNPNAEVVVWTYGASGTWSTGDDAQARLIRRLPQDLIFLSDFSKGGHVKIGQVEERVYDYSISFLGPAEKFQEQVKLCGERDIRVWAKTECMISLEFIQVPYIPVYQRWIERYRRIHTFTSVQGLFMNWDHCGFMPSRVLELARWYTFDPLPDDRSLLTQIATRDFGREAATDVLQAWSHFGNAITHYPFSGTVAVGPIQSGPALPLFLDPDYKVHHGRGRQFSNNLLWTRPWGPDLCASTLRQLEEEWSRGNELLRRLISTGKAKPDREIMREEGVAQAILCCVRSVLNQIEFNELRFELMKQGSPPGDLALLSRMQDVVRREVDNSSEALRWVSVDSRLGYSNGGGGITIGGSMAGVYTPQMIKKKIDALHRMLETDFANYKEMLGKVI